MSRYGYSSGEICGVKSLVMAYRMRWEGSSARRHGSSGRWSLWWHYRIGAAGCGASHRLRRTVGGMMHGCRRLPSAAGQRQRHGAARCRSSHAKARLALAGAGPRGAGSNREGGGARGRHAAWLPGPERAASGAAAWPLGDAGGFGRGQSDAPAVGRRDAGPGGVTVEVSSAFIGRCALWRGP